MAITANLDELLDEAYRNSTVAELVAAPVSALAGVDEAQAEGLRLAFDINTIGDLAKNDFVRAATAISAMAEVAGD